MLQSFLYLLIKLPIMLQDFHFGASKNLLFQRFIGILTIHLPTMLLAPQQAFLGNTV